MKKRILGGLAVLPVVIGLAACGMGSDSEPTGATQLPSGTAPGAPTAASLAGEWQLVSLQRPGQGPQSPHDSGAFTADFGRDGRVSLAADCNRCVGSYSSGEASLEVGAMACTRAYCSSAPLDTQYVQLLQGARQWSVSGRDLTLTAAAGTLRMRRP
jgi:heat shock protein HslJ